MAHSQTKNRKRFHSLYLLQIILITLFFSCQTTKSVIRTPNVNITEQYEVCSAINYTCFADLSFPVIYHLVKVDLSNSSISLTAEPPTYIEHENFTVIKGETTASFAKRTGCIVAVNTSPFNYTNKNGKINVLASKSGGLLFDSGYRILSGIQVNKDGSVFGNTIERYSAVMYSETKGGHVFVSQQEIPQVLENISEKSLVIGGFFTILKDNNIYGDYASIQDSRTAIGFSADGLTMFILCVEGERKWQSRGLDYASCAKILKEAGATNAIEMDGGGSTSLIINGENMLSYTPHRKVANNIGVFYTGKTVLQN